MRWPRDVVEAAAGIRSARSLLIVMTRAMVAGMDEDRTEIPASAISLDAVAAIVTVMIGGNVDAAIATAIGTTAVGATSGKSPNPQITPILKSIWVICG